MESFLVFLFILLMSAGFNWLKKRSSEFKNLNDEKQKTDPPMPYRGRPRHVPTSQPPVFRTPPPPLPQPATPPALNWEEELRKALGMEPVTHPPIPQPRPVRTAPPLPVLVAEETLMEEEGGERRKGRNLLQQAETSFRYASHLSDRVASQLKKVSDGVGVHRFSASSTAQSQVSRNAIGMLRDPKGFQQALVASIILGPPRALENSH